MRVFQKTFLSIFIFFALSRVSFAIDVSNITNKDLLKLIDAYNRVTGVLSNYESFDSLASNYEAGLKRAGKCSNDDEARKILKIIVNPGDPLYEDLLLSKDGPVTLEFLDAADGRDHIKGVLGDMFVNLEKLLDKPIDISASTNRREFLRELSIYTSLKANFGLLKKRIGLTISDFFTGGFHLPKPEILEDVEDWPDEEWVEEEWLTEEGFKETCADTKGKKAIAEVKKSIQTVSQKRRELINILDKEVNLDTMDSAPEFEKLAEIEKAETALKDAANDLNKAKQGLVDANNSCKTCKKAIKPKTCAIKPPGTNSPGACKKVLDSAAKTTKELGELFTKKFPTFAKLGGPALKILGAAALVGGVFDYAIDSDSEAGRREIDLAFIRCRKETNSGQPLSMCGECELQAYACINKAYQGLQYVNPIEIGIFAYDITQQCFAKNPSTKATRTKKFYSDALQFIRNKCPASYDYLSSNKSVSDFLEEINIGRVDGVDSGNIYVRNAQCKREIEDEMSRMSDRHQAIKDNLNTMEDLSQKVLNNIHYDKATPFCAYIENPRSGECTAEILAHDEAFERFRTTHNADALAFVNSEKDSVRRNALALKDLMAKTDQLIKDLEHYTKVFNQEIIDCQAFYSDFKVKLH